MSEELFSKKTNDTESTKVDKAVSLDSLHVPAIEPKTNAEKVQELLAAELKPNQYGEPVYMTKEEMNTWLNKNGFHTLDDRYFSDENQYKIVGICPDNIYKHGNYYAVIPFQVQLPNGKEFCYPLQMNCNSVQSFGIVYVPMIGDKFILVQEPRAGVGKKVWGFPRGFPELEPSDDTIYVEGLGNINVRVLLRELGEEVCKNIDPKTVKATYYADIFEDSSTKLNATSCVKIVFSNPDIIDGGTEGLKIAFFSEPKMKQMVNNGEICDAHTKSAFCSYLCSK